MRHTPSTSVTTRTFSIHVVLLLVVYLPGSAYPEQAVSAYQELRIVEPDDGSAFWSGAGEVAIKVAVQPSLMTTQGHRLRVYLDQEMAGGIESVTLTNVDRGTHEVYAEIVNEDGRILIKSPRIRFTLHRPSVLSPP